MAVSFAGFLTLLLLGCVGVGGSRVPAIDCQVRRELDLSENKDGVWFFVDGRVVDAKLFCSAVRCLVELGCGFDGLVDGDRWRRVRTEYCVGHLSGSASDRWEFADETKVQINSISGRKILRHLLVTSSAISEPCGVTQQEGRNMDLAHITLSSEKMTIVGPSTILFCCVFLCPCFRSKRKSNPHESTSRDIKVDSIPSYLDASTLSERILGTQVRASSSPIRVPPSPSRFSLSSQLNTVGSVHLSFSQIIRATQNFSPTNLIGEGGFGTVYKAQLLDGQVVAIKRARKEQAAHLKSEFSNEVEFLSKIEHRNLVRLLGYIEKENERIIVTEYVPNGNLREHLDGHHGAILDFNQRLEISIDVSHALTYLHSYAEKQIIHRDVKSSSILLSEGLRAKVADFGFARSGPANEDQTHISTNVKGTAGYLDPEYVKTYQLTSKSDVFSFGILLLEILSGRRPVEPARGSNEKITVKWAFKKFDEGNLMDILDPELHEVIDEKILSKLLGLAFQCAAPIRADRPDMKEVVEMLWEIRKDYIRNRKSRLSA